MEISNLIVKKDYKKIFINQIFDEIIKEKYKNNFKNFITFKDFCKKIDEKIYYYFQENNLLDRGVREIFFKLNEILSCNQELKKYFKKLMKERGIIIFKLLENKEIVIDNIVKTVEKVVEKNNISII